MSVTNHPQSPGRTRREWTCNACRTIRFAKRRQDERPSRTGTRIPDISSTAIIRRLDRHPVSRNHSESNRLFRSSVSLPRRTFPRPVRSSEYKRVYETRCVLLQNSPDGTDVARFAYASFRQHCKHSLASSKKRG